MKKVNSKIKRKIRNRKKLKNINSNKLRITVFKSTKNISAQIIDDKVNKTLTSASSTEKELKKSKGKKMDLSKTLGELLAKRAKEKKINNVYFDRGGYKYHGRIKALADSLRKNGLKI
tara:strand:+ start:589 stop:942 length:354 start_codon:yes stop_codon:yes gene_type:complete